MRKDNSKINIYVACHKPSVVPDNPCLKPIQVGAALAATRMDGMLYDDIGENISEKNKSFCEMTAQYWAWKNEDADYFGFFHYRRYFSFNQEQEGDIFGNVVYDRITDDVINEIQLQPERMQDVITQYDVVTVRGRTLPDNNIKGIPTDNYHSYGVVPFQHKKDLDTALEVLKELHPEYGPTADEYMRSDVAYECNMYILSKEQFNKYCEWVFSILFETEKRIDTTWYSVEEYRVMGYLAERLWGIYYSYLKTKPEIKRLELAKTLFTDTDPETVIEPVFKEAVPVILSASNVFSPYLDVMIRSVVANSSSKNNYDIIILHSNISKENRAFIESAADGHSNISIRFRDVKKYFDSGKLFVTQHLSIETYYRLIIPTLLPDYKKVLYLDSDMVVEADVADLYRIDIGDNTIGAVKDIDVAGQVGLDINNWKKYIKDELKLNGLYDYFQAGVLILNLEAIRKLTNSEKLISVATGKKWRCEDQDVLNHVCNGSIHYLPQEWNVLMNWQAIDGRSRMDIMKMAYRDLYNEYLSARKAPKIVHFAGYQKPWDVFNCDMSGYFWKYASMSPFYPLIIRKIKTTLENEPVDKVEIKESVVRKLSAKVLPYDSRRRETLKRVVFSVVKKK